MSLWCTLHAFKILQGISCDCGVSKQTFAWKKCLEKKMITKPWGSHKAHFQCLQSKCVYFPRRYNSMFIENKRVLNIHYFRMAFSGLSKSKPSCKIQRNWIATLKGSAGVQRLCFAFFDSTEHTAAAPFACLPAEPKGKKNEFLQNTAVMFFTPQVLCQSKSTICLSLNANSVFTIQNVNCDITITLTK